MQQVHQLIAQGRVADAIQRASQLASAGNADALFALGTWRLAGRLMPRDLSMSRELFRRAAEAGSLDAARVHTAFVANGTGGPSEWAKAIAQLRILARKDSQAKRQLWLIDKMSIDEQGDPCHVPDGEPLSQDYEIVLYRKLLTAPECSYLAEAAASRLQPSVVVDNSGHQVPHPDRTSDTAGFPWSLENPAVHALNRRLARISNTEVHQGEPLQILRYRPGQEYRPHLDAVPGLENQRQITALVYLNDDYSGGETSFPNLEITVRGNRGDALIFRNCGADGRPTDAMLHAGLPVTRGTKIIASRWIRQRRLEA